MTEFRGQLGNYRIIKTEDDTETIYSEYFDEACHNLSGAYEETIHNYILGCDIPEKFNQKNSIAVFDVGFGAGVGLQCLMKAMKEGNILHYYSIELDELLIKWTLEHNLPELSLNKIEKSGFCFYQGQFQDKVFITLFAGDGRLTLPKAQAEGLLRPFDAIFQDPFSPKKNPALWTVEWFSLLKLLSQEDVLMSTYSSSISIRKSMIKAGWAIENARGFAMKKTMTKANLTGKTSAELLDQLARSPSLEITDK